MANRNRGKKSNDDKIFAPKWWPIFKEAADDYCFLLSRSYSENSIIQIVGNRYKLNARQRMAIQRICASDEQIRTRKDKLCKVSEMKGSVVGIDGFNLIILLESALSGAYIFEGRDKTFKDISSVHGTYKRVVKTEQAIVLIGEELKRLKIRKAKWFLDKPVSNSGRLKVMLLDIANIHNLNWEVELVYNPDKELAIFDGIVISSDGWILDKAEHWFNLGARIIIKNIKPENLIST